MNGFRSFPIILRLLFASLISAALGLSSSASWADDAEPSKNESFRSKSQDGAKSQERGASPEIAVAVFAGGCFWCSEAVFERVKGVQDVVSGYTGGHVPHPTHGQVKSKRTGHAEAVEIHFAPDVVSYKELLKIFFKTHDPTTPSQQGIDHGPQYRSVVFYRDEEQKSMVESVIKTLTEEHHFRRPIVTEVLATTVFYVAEEYHQDYFRRNPHASYCRRVVRKKVRKLKNAFPNQVQPVKP